MGHIGEAARLGRDDVTATCTLGPPERNADRALIVRSVPRKPANVGVAANCPLSDVSGH
jgi:hypothetical protein